MDAVRQEINEITQELRDVATILENDFVHVDVAKPLPDTSLEDQEVEPLDECRDVQQVERTLQMLVFKQINVFNILQKVHTRQVKMSEQLNFIQKFIVELHEFNKSLDGTEKSVEDVLNQDVSEVLATSELCTTSLCENSQYKEESTTKRMVCLFCLCVFVLWYAIGFASVFA